MTKFGAKELLMNLLNTAAMTVRWISKREGTRIIVCTGERMESLVHRIYPDIRTTTFLPEHAQGQLANEFRCYSNFESTAWKWR